MISEVEKIYDDLHLFERTKRGNTFPVHKSLKLPDHHNLVAFIKDIINIEKGSNILDAGCGNGFLLFELSKEYRISGLGVSLSRAEIQTAITRKNGTSDLAFRQMDFDADFRDKFDYIFAIESLKHSISPVASLKHWIGHLKESGVLIIADDFINSGQTQMDHCKLWSSHRLGDPDEFINNLAEIGDFTIESYDLSPFVPKRNIVLLNLEIFVFRLLLKLKSSRSVKTYLGGLLLEKLYHMKEANYALLTIQKT